MDRHQADAEARGELASSDERLRQDQLGDLVLPLRLISPVTRRHQEFRPARLTKTRPIDVRNTLSRVMITMAA
jgi:hypothetical protein